MITGAVALVLGALCFVPSWLSADRTLDFLETTSELAGLRVHLGRWAIKNVAFFGVLAGVVLAFGLPRLRRAWPSWHTSVTVPLRCPGLRRHRGRVLPLPVQAAAPHPRRHGGGARHRPLRHRGPPVDRRAHRRPADRRPGDDDPAAPDVEDRASSGEIQLGLTAGPLLTDVQCRLDDRDDGPYEDGTSEESTERAERNAACQLETWRASP